MPLSYGARCKNARMVATRNDIDAGLSAAKIEICTAGFTTVLVTVPLEYPCGTVTADVLTLAGFPKIIAADADGVAALIRIRDSNNVVVGSGLTVGVAGSGADVIIDNTTITEGNDSTITSVVITHAS